MRRLGQHARVLRLSIVTILPAAFGSECSGASKDAKASQPRSTNYEHNGDALISTYTPCLGTV